MRPAASNEREDFEPFSIEIWFIVSLPFISIGSWVIEIPLKKWKKRSAKVTNNGIKYNNVTFETLLSFSVTTFRDGQLFLSSQNISHMNQPLKSNCRRGLEWLRSTWHALSSSFGIYKC